eukprot:9498403-Prorocentrum_lima.AAC.1
MEACLHLLVRHFATHAVCALLVLTPKFKQLEDAVQAWVQHCDGQHRDAPCHFALACSEGGAAPDCGCPDKKIGIP